MKLHEQEGLRFLSFELLDEAGLCNAVTLSPLNMAFEKAPDQEEVLRNFKTVQQHFGLTDLAYTRQRHGDQITEIRKRTPIPTGDALMTEESSLGLLLSHADCQIACFYDPIKKVIASAHAGWRGNVKQLYTKTISALRQRYGSFPANLLAAVSPSLGPAHSEFVNWQAEWPEALWRYRLGTYFDLWQMAEDELLEAGLLPHHIQIARLCTYSDPDKFFSYRRAVHQGLQGATPVCNATLIAMKGVINQRQ